jgi:hypothetical protein
MVTTAIASDTSSFENDSYTLARPLQDSLPQEWETIRDGHIQPLHASKFSDDVAMREEFLAGAELLGLLEDGQTIHPQQLMVSDIIGTGEETVVIEMPRRSSKTTSILCALLGRCLTRPRYKVTFSAQSGTKSAEFFRDWLADLELHQGDAPESAWPFKPRLQAGSMMLTFKNGSTFKVLNTPTAKALRGGAADVVWFDESQEFGPEQSAELKAGALPLMDTRDDAQLILSGTAGEFRAGWFWDTLETGREAGAGVAILEFAAPADTTHEDIDNENVWQAAHPGIGSLTTLTKMRARRAAFADPEWSREYLGLWPVSADSAIISSAVWEGAGLSKKMSYPESFALGYDVSPNGSTAAIVAAWRVDGVAYVELIEHQSGSSWVRDRVTALSTKYRASIGYDSIGTNKTISEEIQRSRSSARSRLKPVTYKDLPQSCVTFLRDLEDGKLHHFNQGGMNDAATFAAKRSLGEASWAWGRVASGGDIVPLVAATMALRVFDTSSTKGRLRAIVA